MDRPLTESQRFPLLTDAGRRLLQELYEHPHAPRFNHRCGDRLTAEGLARVRQFEANLRSATGRWCQDERPLWLDPFLQHCLESVPYYQRLAPRFDRWEDVPSTRRADLAAAPWLFVSDGQPLDDLIVYTTSGTTTGHPLNVLCHPECSSFYLPLLRWALEGVGVALAGGQGRVSIVLVCHQRRTYTYASISTYLDQAGFAKVNLHPGEWRDAEDRARFLDDCQPEVYTGDPLAFAELAKLPLRTRPKALISTAMALLPGHRAQLEQRFGCPVLDLYSLNESGPVAVRTARGFEVLPHDLYVEVLDEHDRPCPPGQRGEIALTGGHNAFLPLLRYRTGDWARLEHAGRQPILMDLEGRAPTVFRSTSGQPINNVDVSWALRDLPLSQFTLRQAADGAVSLAVADAAALSGELRQRLLGLFGADQRVVVRELDPQAAATGKVAQYVSEFVP